VTPAAFADSVWRGQVEVIDCPEFRPQIQAWLLHRPPAGRLARPIALLRETLIEALREPTPLLA